MSESSLNPAGHKTRGRLTIYLGYAAGTGKTFRMLEEAQKLKTSGCDIALGYFEPHGRKDTIEKAEGLEIIPRRTINYKSSTFEEMDTRAILERHPSVCVVDEFAHTNVPGADRKKRWEDVIMILDEGIDVLTTLNVQHIESLNDHVWQVTGIRVRETVPDWVVLDADELVMVDVTPRALVHRLERGVVYSPEKAKDALEHFFTETNLAALRELALRQAAHQVEERREDNAPSRIQSANSNVTPDRLLLHLTDHPSTAGVIRRAKRVADYLHADCYAIYVAADPDLANLSAEECAAVERHIGFASSLHIATCLVPGNDVAKSIAEFAREHRITQLFLSRNAPELGRIIENARDLEITVVAGGRR